MRAQPRRDSESHRLGVLHGLVFGDGSWNKQEIRFMPCMSHQGFRLPEPTKDTSGSYDIDEWRFDLTPTNIDTSTRAWNRAMFVVCAPDHI